MDENLYQVVISGRIMRAFKILPSIHEFARIFIMDKDDAVVLFDKAPCVVRDDLSRELAEQYCRVLNRVGVQCDFQLQQPIKPALPCVGIYPRLS